MNTMPDHIVGHRALGVVRMQLINKWTFLGIPAVIIANSFLRSAGKSWFTQWFFYFVLMMFLFSLGFWAADRRRATP